MDGRLRFTGSHRDTLTVRWPTTLRSVPPLRSSVWAGNTDKAELWKQADCRVKSRLRNQNVSNTSRLSAKKTAFSKKRSQNKIFVMLVDAGQARISVGTFSYITFPVVSEERGLWLDDWIVVWTLLTSCEKWFFFLLFCNLNCCLRELLAVFFLVSLPACVQPKYDNVSHHRRAPPAGFTGINYWGLLPPPKNIKNV